MTKQLTDRHDGFTLLELLLVVCVLALVAGIGAPHLVGVLQKRALESTAWTVSSQLTQARSRGLLGLPQAGATFTAGSAQYSVGGKTCFLDRNFVSGTSITVEFASLGTVINSSDNLTVSLLDPSTQEQISVTIATYGFITWATNQ